MFVSYVINILELKDTLYVNIIMLLGLNTLLLLYNDEVSIPVNRLSLIV